MEYISIHEISEKWNMKERKVTAFCREGRIAGAKKFGKTWMIPQPGKAKLDVFLRRLAIFPRECWRKGKNRLKRLLANKA